MDKALLQAGVAYLTGCYATDVLRDTDGRLAGVVMANRSGRQAVRAKVIVDATRQAAVARLANAAFRRSCRDRGPSRASSSAAKCAAARTCLSSKRILPTTRPRTKRTNACRSTNTRCRSSWKTTASPPGPQAEHQARDMTHAEGSETASEVLSYEPSDTIVGQGLLDAWPGADRADLAPFRPARDSTPVRGQRLCGPGKPSRGETPAAPGIDGTGHADRPCGRGRSQVASVPRQRGTPRNGGRGRSPRRDRRGPGRDPADGPRYDPRRPSALPVLGQYDVVVVGGGTSGAPAGIASAKSGARTLVIEYLYELGGVGTVGLIAEYWYGRRKGYTEYVDQQVNPGKPSWKAAAKAEWLRRELVRSGADVWLGTFGCGALTEAGKSAALSWRHPWDVASCWPRR